MKCVRWITALGFLLVFVAVHGDTNDEPERRALPSYGSTPEDLRPFGRFVEEPYKMFFVEPLEFTGPGREKPEPEVETVKIGLLTPLERTHEAYIGQPIFKGTKLAIEEANAAGGYKGKPYELVVRNDEGLWGASANEVVAFSYEDSVWAIIGTVDGANAHIAIRVALRTEVPMMNVGDTDPTLVETMIPWVFRNIPDDRQMAYALAYHMYRDVGYQRVAIVRADNLYGRFGVRQFRDASVRLGRPAPIEINYEVKFEHVNPEFTAQIQRLNRVNPDAIVLWADADAAGHLVRRMRDAGLTMPVYACERIVHPMFLDIAGEAAEGVVAGYPYNPDADIPELRQFRAQYRQRFGEDPNTFAAHAYDGTWMVINAIETAGLNRYLIRDALAEMDTYYGITGKAVFDDVYSNRRRVIMATVRDGRFIYNEPKLTVSF